MYAPRVSDPYPAPMYAPRASDPYPAPLYAITETTHKPVLSKDLNDASNDRRLPWQTERLQQLPEGIHQWYAGQRELPEMELKKG